VAAALLVFAVFWFPFGLMLSFYQTKVIGALPRGEQLLQIREGPLQTTAYTRMDYLGQPDYYRLVTDSYSMSGTGLTARRYMALYTYLPLALHPGAKDALLISFGVGTTARSLTDTEEFEHIDVVDISRDVIEMSSLRFAPEENPLNDPRVTVYIEDGRFFLNSTERRYDLITAEPPPPHVAGVENLYSQEYFERVRSRLKEGGLVSYWLPIINYDLEEARATVKGFCAAFPDCTLWDAAPMNWTLLGSRNAVPVDEAAIRRQWQSAKAWPELELTGFERPEQVAALFLAGARDLEEWTRDSLPLVDNWPSRAPRVPKVWMQPPPHYAEWMSLPGTRERFEQSEFIRSVWPESFRAKSLPYFELQEFAGRQLYAVGSPQSMALIHRILTTTDLETLPLWMLGSQHVHQRIAESLESQKGVTANEVRYELGLKALVDRDYAGAAELFGQVHGGFKIATALRFYALCMAGQADQARLEARGFRGLTPPNYWGFMESEFGLQRPSLY
jgi:spermidine synthase